ncbi:MAG: beta-ketoacyl synthase N-terminal-like domain-containing protein, partial [Candidatus Polarisedimenticolia bacterium]
SGLAAIATAAELIRSGAADRIVAGGADEYPPAIDRAWRALRIVAREGAVPPVGSSEGRAGRFAPGEGAYFVVLESGEEAGGRGAVPWCAVRRVEVSHRSCEPHRRPVVAESGWPIRSAIGECGAASAAAALMAALSIRDRIPPPPGSSSGPGAGEGRFPVRAAGAGGADVTVVLEPAGD